LDSDISAADINGLSFLGSPEREPETHKNFDERIPLSLSNLKSTEAANINNRQNDNIKKIIDRFLRLSGYRRFSSPDHTIIPSGKETAVRNHKPRGRNEYNRRAPESDNFKEKIRFAKKSIVLIAIYRNPNLNFFNFSHFPRSREKLADLNAEKKNAREELIVVKNDKAISKKRFSSNKIIHGLSVKRRKRPDLFTIIISENSDSENEIISIDILRFRRNEKKSRLNLNNILFRTDRC
jgi:hypothetical protein